AEPHHWSPWWRCAAPRRTAKQGRAGLQRCEDRARRDLTLDVELHRAVDARQLPQTCRERDADHGRAWTSTDSTAGRSRTMGAQLFPASDDAYTCPPVVPKYTPPESSEATPNASRTPFH